MTGTPPHIPYANPILLHLGGKYMEIEKVLQNFTRRGLKALYFETSAEAADYVAGRIRGKTVGIGGSKTIDTMGLYERLQENNTVYWHWKQGPEARDTATKAQVYLTSANGISEDGQLVNIDGNGNRVAQTLYGHELVIFISGVNKIMPDLEQAIWRARNIASPLNARRFNVNTPCVKSEPMKCHDCRSPERICNGMVITMGKMSGVGEMEVVLIGEELGY